jgi:hypothetical protein
MLFPALFRDAFRTFARDDGGMILGIGQQRIKLGRGWESGRVDQNGKSSSGATRAVWTAAW